MRFEQARISPLSLAVRRSDIDVEALPPLPRDIAFLVPHVDRASLLAAVRVAEHEGVPASRVLIARDVISDTLYYKILADHLRLRFVNGWVLLAPDADKIGALRRGYVRLAPGDGDTWLVAPTDAAIDLLLDARGHRGLAASGIAITTPSQFSRTVRNGSREAIAHVAQDGLPDQTPHLSARHAAGAGAARAATCGVGLCLAAAWLCPFLFIVAIGSLFFAAMVFRLMVYANGLAASTCGDMALPDSALPPYSVLVPLHREAGMVEGLVASLVALDYPRSKLEILFLLEPHDHETELALQRCELPPGFRIVIAPRGTIATKPRALNVGLMLARGKLITVFDAEDRPEPDQLRKAAARFAAVPDEVACLQARLAISNAHEGVLPRLFALEYAALFDIYNVGLARWKLPIALGGTSNHFRAEALRATGGWDAYNVAEDADLGLRLARFGYQTRCLDSTTWEAALATPAAWINQRRRWTKGWIQTLLVLARDGGAARALGPCHAGAVALTLTNLVVGPLVTPIASVFVVGDLYRHGLPSPHGSLAIGEATLAASVVLLGLASPLWCGFAASRRRRVKWAFLSLPLLLPYQLLVSVAAWRGLVDLIVAPYHWHKTEHCEVTLENPLIIESQTLAATAPH